MVHAIRERLPVLDKTAFEGDGLNRTCLFFRVSNVYVNGILPTLFGAAGAAAGEAAAEGATTVAEASRDDAKSPTAAAAAAAVARNRKGQGKSKSSGNNRGGRNLQKRRVETVHAGSYAGGCMEVMVLLLIC